MNKVHIQIPFTVSRNVLSSNTELVSSGHPIASRHPGVNRLGHLITQRTKEGEKRGLGHFECFLLNWLNPEVVNVQILLLIETIITVVNFYLFRPKILKRMSLTQNFRFYVYGVTMT